MSNETGKAGTWGEFFRLVLKETWPALIAFAIGFGLLWFGTTESKLMACIWILSGGQWMSWIHAEAAHKRVKAALDLIDAHGEHIKTLYQNARAAQASELETLRLLHDVATRGKDRPS
jgi:hypothetical protein